MKHLTIQTLILLLSMLLTWGCKDETKDLLAPKVYFESKESKVEVGDDDASLEQTIRARVSSAYGSTIDITYALADRSAVDAFNSKNGTNYKMFDPSQVQISNTRTTIQGGEIYSDKVSLKLSALDKVEAGTSYLLPVRIASAGLPVIAGTDITYFVISKPVRIRKAAGFSSDYIKVPILPGTIFKSVTYEALIYIDYLGGNNTIMGGEGVLILRIGDPALPDGHNDWLQIAGSKQYHSTQSFVTGRWYHVAFTYDQPSGKTALYINGVKASESTWDNPGFDLSTGAGGFFIGKVAGFMWGERAFNGKMSEVRLWNVARTENQIKQNMLSVNPSSDGLAAYYKLNGKDQFQKDGKWFVKDASKNGMDGIVNGGFDQLNVVDLPEPISIK